jgi:DNA-directed RNA polymerase specialized sigma24 family protein
VTYRYGKYTEEEVEALVEGYTELIAYRHKPYLMVRLLDVQRAIRWCSQKSRDALFVVGVLGIPLRDAGVALEVSKDTAQRRYRRGLQELTRKLNGGRSG